MKAKPVSTGIMLLVIGLVFAACQSKPSAAPSEGQSSAPTRVGAVENTQAAPAQPEKPSGGSGAYRLDNMSVGLDALSSYRQSLVLKFDGMLNGVETHSKTSVRRTLIRQPAAQLTWLQIDDTPEQMVATLGEVSYQQTGVEGVCFANPIESQSGELPAVFQLETLPAVIEASVAGEESVNSVRTTHYTFDESAIGRAGEGKAQGNLWVAKEGGYVVKYTLSIVGEDNQLGPGVKGTQTWEYELTDANTVSGPDLPAGCVQGQVEDISPLPPDAKNILRMPNFLQFDVALSSEETAQFYKDQAAELKWEEIPSTPMKDADMIHNFKTADGGTLSIRLHKQEGGTRVTIQVLPGKP